MSDRGRVWLDGKVHPLAEARVPVSDRGFLFADSIFETVRTYGCRPFLLGDHIDRLHRSAAALSIPLPASDEELEESVETLLEGWPAGEEATVRIVITRGDGGQGLALPDPQRPRLVILARPLAPLPPSAYQDGVTVGLPQQSTTKNTEVLARVKSGSYVAGVLALSEVRERGHLEALLRAVDGHWSEATTSNFFLVQSGRILTPRIQDDILPGVTRAVVLAACRRAGLPVQEVPIEDADLSGAEEAFLTSSIKEVVPVVAIEDEPVGAGVPGPMTRQVQELFAEAVARIRSGGHTRWREVFSG